MSFANPVAQSDVANVTPQMQAGLGTIAGLQPEVTSVMHGEHVADSAHYAGKAVDVGAFGGTDVGFNPTTWGAISYAIRSGKFSKIGTIGRIANDPTMQAYARAYGVQLFEDEGSGPHVHFQVP